MYSHIYIGRNIVTYTDRVYLYTRISIVTYVYNVW